MKAHSWSASLAMAAAYACISACGGGNGNNVPAPAPAQPFFQKGWSHNCTLSCINVSVNQAETVERPGRAGPATVCRDSQQACERGRDAACADAVAMTNNETLYDNCQLLAVGECVEGCTLPQ